MRIRVLFTWDDFKFSLLIMDIAGIEDASETSNSQSQGLDDLYKATLSDTGQTYELPFPIQTVECYTSDVGDHYENEGSSVLDLDKGQVRVFKITTVLKYIDLDFFSGANNQSRAVVRVR